MREQINVWLGGLLGQVSRKELMHIARRYHVPLANRLDKENLIKEIIEVENLLEETLNHQK